MSAATAVEDAPAAIAPGLIAKMVRNRAVLIGGTIVLLFAVAALFAPLSAPYDPLKANFLYVRKPPSEMFWLGTDELGRDIFSRLLWGARASLLAGAFSVFIALATGVPIGLAAGYFGGWIDAILSRIIEAILSCPFLILAIAFATFLGPSLANAMIAIGLSAMPIFARLTRGQVLTVRAQPYIEGARAIGLPDSLIVLRYILPNVRAPIIVQLTLTIGTAIIAEASLSFLGLGQQPPWPSWGTMLNTAKNYIEQSPWMSISPGLAIFLVALGFNLLGNGLRDVLDPSQN